MADNIPGGDIISRWLITTKDAEAALSRGVGLVTGFVTKINSALLSASQFMGTLGRGMTNLSRSFGILSASIFLPLTLGFKDFADKNQIAREKIKELWAELQKVPPFSAAAKQLQQQIQYYANMERSTRSAAVAQGQLSQAFMTLKNTIEQLVVGVIIPYVPRIQSIVNNSIVWIQANRALATTFLGIALKVGAVAAGLAILLKVGGEFFKLFSVGLKVIAFFASPIGLLVGAVAALAYVFRGPIMEALTPLIPKLKELWDSWREGSLTTRRALDELSVVITDFFLNLTGTNLDQWKIFWDGVVFVVDGVSKDIINLINRMKAAIKGFFDSFNLKNFLGFAAGPVGGLARVGLGVGAGLGGLPALQNLAGTLPSQAAGAPVININGMIDNTFVSELQRLVQESYGRILRQAFQ